MCVLNTLLVRKWASSTFQISGAARAEPVRKFEFCVYRSLGYKQERVFILRFFRTYAVSRIQLRNILFVLFESKDPPHKIYVRGLKKSTRTFCVFPIKTRFIPIGEDGNCELARATSSLYSYESTPRPYIRFSNYFT